MFITELTDLLQRFLFLFGVREAMTLEQKFFCMFIIVCLLILNLSRRVAISSLYSFPYELLLHARIILAFLLARVLGSVEEIIFLRVVIVSRSK